MPEFTAMFWNIQNLGGEGRYYEGLMSFIAAAALQKSADVVALMELHSAGVDQLGLLRAALNEAYELAEGPHDWHFDWIPAAIDGHLPDHVMPNTYGHLEWEMHANNEGYAVFWNNTGNLSAMAAANAMSGGVDRNLARDGFQGDAPDPGVPANILQLVFEGRRRGAPPNHFDAGDYPNARPYAAVGDMEFERLDFLTNISNVPLRTTTRRPCHCTFQLLGGADAHLGDILSFLVFHAPGVIAFSQVAAVATRLFSFSQPLFRDHAGAPPRWVVAGGDLNVNVNGGPAYLLPSLNGFLNPLNHAAVPGANCLQLVPAADASDSNIQLASGAFGAMGDPILEDDPAAYRNYAIDHVYHRGFAAADVDGNPPIYDLITAVMVQDGPFHEAISMFANHFYEDPPDLDDPAIDPLDLPDPDLHDLPNSVQSEGEFLLGIVTGTFPTARSAAEFVRLMISDHLPVVFRVQY